MIRCTCGAELFSIESICSACLPPKPPRALFVEDLRIKLANREEELLDWKETVELVNTENVELRAERDRLKAALGELQEDNMWLQAVQGNLRSIMRAHQKDCPNCHGKGAVEVPYDSADLNDTSTVTEHCKQCARLRAALGDAS